MGCGAYTLSTGGPHLLQEIVLYNLAQLPVAGVPLLDPLLCARLEGRDTRLAQVLSVRVGHLPVSLRLGGLPLCDLVLAHARVAFRDGGRGLRARLLLRDLLILYAQLLDGHL